MTEPKNKPVAEVKSGMIVASIWGNESEKGTRYSITFSLLYKAKDGQWKRGTSFGQGDLPNLAKVADLAHAKMAELTGSPKDQ